MIRQYFLNHPELFLFLFTSGASAFLLLRQYRFNRAPEYIASATVLSRRLGTAGFHGKYSSGYNHLVTFQLRDNDTLELYVGREEYALLTEGLRGTLRWQNENFLSFETEE